MKLREWDLILCRIFLSVKGGQIMPYQCGERGSALVTLVVGAVTIGQMCPQSIFILPILCRPAYCKFG
jgi:hypothetical protein